MATFPSATRASILDGIGFQFEESMSGYLAEGASDPREGARRGRDQGTTARFDVVIRIDDLGRFLRTREHLAQLTGTITLPFPRPGGTFSIRDGQFNLFTIDDATGQRRMSYAFNFTAADGQAYRLEGHKEIQHDPGKFDAVEDMTRLFTVVRRGDAPQAPVYAAGELYFKLADAPALVASMKVERAASWRQKAAAYAAFTSFAYGVLRDEYLKDIRILYDTQYDNLVLSGKLADGGRQAPFFLVCGVHDRGFPWGDCELFSDVLLVIGDGQGGYRRYCITDRVLEGLELDIAAGACRYDGPLFALGGDSTTSFSQMRKRPPSLDRRNARFSIVFGARAFDAVPFPFPLVPKLVRKLSSAMSKELKNVLPGEHPLGINIRPHLVTIRSGSLRITGQDGEGAAENWSIVPAETFGEAECGAFRNLKEPKLLYGYLCALWPAARAARVQILARTLRTEREHWGKDRLDAYLGTVVSRQSSAEMLLHNDSLRVSPLPPAGRPGERAALLKKLEPCILDVANDHFPTAVLHRRVVAVQDPSGEQTLALEEDMSLIRLEAINCRRTVTVACIRDADKYKALDRVLEETAFDDLVEAKLRASGKSRPDFAIAIKPNFMFAYSKYDPTTYTDPELVHHLVRRLRANGFRTISVVEAQSTYGQYFDKRRVREVAEYLGFDEDVGFKVVDMTEDASEMRQLGPHLGYHPVSRVWQAADYRISFAKNKTHAYAYYTLTLKNIYGALPLPNKFKEYHCQRGIYETTIEYLKAFPVDYGLVDGYVSADGPFGIFADPTPNYTETVIGGADLVAVDWVAASKMGIEPMISKYMRLAVDEFGKPEIRLVGDASPYRPWLNVPVVLTLFTGRGLDASYHLGNLFYAAAAQMDETHFHYKNKAWYMALVRRLTLPLRRAFFVRTGENPSLGNRLAGWLFYRLGL